MTQDEMKQAVARAALEYVVEGRIVGVGTGSTARLFIEELAGMKDRIAGAVASSEDTRQRLEKHGIRVFDLNDISDMPIYIDGADEIDMVIDRGAFLSGDYAKVYDEIMLVKEACARPDGSFASLKVILETGELKTYDNIKRASWLAILAGGDFIKTSTGKVQPAATLPVTLLMLEVVRDWYRATGERIS